MTRTWRAGAVRPSGRAGLAGLATATVLAGLAAIGAPAAAAAVAAPLTDTSVTVRVLDMVPTTAVGTDTPSPLTLTVSVTNTTDQALHSVALNAQRDAPINRQSQLEQLMAHPVPGAADEAQPMPAMALADLAPHAITRVTYRTTTSALLSAADICLCMTGVYPIEFSVTATGTDGVATRTGLGLTYLPYFQTPPAPVRISWVWPLIDHPHRLSDDRTFADASLDASIGAGGRLDRMLAVAERVSARVHLSLVVDPDLIDELAVMASGRYDVLVAGRRTAGTDGAAAAAWLARLRAVLPHVDLHLTPPGDPDVQAISRQPLVWQATPTGDAATRVAEALGRPTLVGLADVYWAPDGSLTPQALGSVLAHGASGLVLDDTVLRGDATVIPRPNAVASVPTTATATPALVAVTDSAVQRWVNSVLGRGAPGNPSLPNLVSELAVRAADDPTASPYVVITPDRHLDPNVPLATRTIVETANTPWSTTLPVRAALRTVTPTDHGPLAAVDPTREISVGVVNQAVAAAQFADSFRGALSAQDAKALLDGVPMAVQRTVSAAWRDRRAQGDQTAAALSAYVGRWRAGVQIAHPSVGTYTLASNSAPLFVTVVNALDVPVTVQVTIATVNNVVGFTATPLTHQTIPARQQVSLRMAVKVQRAGRFQVDASLATPDGTTLGQPVRLQVRSTALGGIGVTITLVATGVLVVALIVRFARRFRHRRPPTPPADAATPPQPAVIGS